MYYLDHSLTIREWERQSTCVHRNRSVPVVRSCFNNVQAMQDTLLYHISVNINSYQCLPWPSPTRAHANDRWAEDEFLVSTMVIIWQRIFQKNKGGGVLSQSACLSKHIILR